MAETDTHIRQFLVIHLRQQCLIILVLAVVLTELMQRFKTRILTKPLSNTLAFQIVLKVF